MNILAIETSCDETSVALLQNGNKLLSNIIFSQIKMHRPFRGIVPEVASRAHVEKINITINQALKAARLTMQELNALAVTVGPGLVGSLLIGKMTAEALAWRHQLPLLGVNHLEAHLLSATFNDQVKPPFLGLIVSGGHSDLIEVKNFGDYNVIGRTRDDAAGECLDKVASLLKLPYPGGPEIDRLAAQGNAKTFNFPRALLQGSFDFSFSGLKTSALYKLTELQNKKQKINLHDFCASFQAAVMDTLVIKTIEAANKLKYKTIVLGGGVSCNSSLRLKFLDAAQKNNMQVFFPEKSWTTDNAAMIALAAHHQLKFLKDHNQLKDFQKIKINPNLTLESWAKNNVEQN